MILGVGFHFDMSLRYVTPPSSDRLDLEMLLRKVGRKVQTAETIFRDAETKDIVAIGMQVFAATPDPKASVERSSRSMRTTGALERPFPEQMGVRVIEPGVVEMDGGPGRGNAMDGLQGGLVVLLGEMAAETLTGNSVIELEVNYLSSIGGGTGRASARLLGEGIVRVEVRDPVRDHRLCAIMLATTEPPL